MDNITPLATHHKDNLAITVTYRFLKNKTPYGQFKETVIKLTEMLQESCDYELVPEWRESTGEVHYHGIIFILLKYEWLTKTLPFLKRCGFIKLKPIDNLEKWKTYYNKNVWLAEKITKLTMPIRQQIIIDKVVKKVMDIPDGETVVVERDVLKQT